MSWAWLTQTGCSHPPSAPLLGPSAAPPELWQTIQQLWPQLPTERLFQLTMMQQVTSMSSCNRPGAGGRGAGGGGGGRGGGGPGAAPVGGGAGGGGGGGGG